MLILFGPKSRIMCGNLRMRPFWRSSYKLKPLFPWGWSGHEEGTGCSLGPGFSTSPAIDRNHFRNTHPRAAVALFHEAPRVLQLFD